MSLVSKIMGTGSGDTRKAKKSAPESTALADGALDTLGNVIRVMGDESFPLEDDVDPARFPDLCAEFACHVENGAAVSALDIPRSLDGSREWGQVRRFFADRRRAEKAFVTERLNNYRGVVEDLVSGLREIGLRDQNTENTVKQSLNVVNEAVGSGALPQIREALSQTFAKINETFEEQRQQYESQLKELNDRMSSLRQDLVAAHEEMKRDALTDAFNRGAFDTAIVQSLNMHFILNQPITVVMIDLDNFKTINDTYGHAAGDEVLRDIGECLARSFIRKSDLVARYGGDEFVVIMNDTSATNAKTVVERFLQYANRVTVPYAGAAATVSCSAGYTEIHETDTVESIMARADQALYQAKAAGRNTARFVSYAADSDAS